MYEIIKFLKQVLTYGSAIVLSKLFSSFNLSSEFTGKMDVIFDRTEFWFTILSRRTLCSAKISLMALFWRSTVSNKYKNSCHRKYLNAMSSY